MSEPTVFKVFADNRVTKVRVANQRAVVVAIPGAQGPRGFPGSGAPISGEPITGTQDGVNTEFTTSAAYQPGTVSLYRNGLREDRGEGYDEHPPNGVTIHDPPAAGDKLRVDYVIA